MARRLQVELDENEIKLLLVAIRQVRHTFTIAERQSQAAGEPLSEDYSPVEEMYERLYAKLAGYLPEPPAGGPARVK